MNTFRVSTCKKCGAPIVWAQTKNDRPMSLDVDPVERGGTFILFQDLGSTTVQAIRPRDFERALLPIFRERFIPHLATCKRAAS